MSLSMKSESRSASSACADVFDDDVHTSSPIRVIDSKETDESIKSDEIKQERSPSPIMPEHLNLKENSGNEIESGTICGTWGTETIEHSSIVATSHISSENGRGSEGSESSSSANEFNNNPTPIDCHDTNEDVIVAGLNTVNGSKSETDLLALGRIDEVRAPSELTETTDGEETESETTSADFDQDDDYEPPAKAQKLTQVILDENALQTSIQSIGQSGDAVHQPYRPINIYILKQKLNEAQAETNLHSVNAENTLHYSNSSFNTARHFQTITETRPSSVQLETLNSIPQYTEQDHNDTAKEDFLDKRFKDMPGILKKVLAENEEENVAMNLSMGPSDITLPSVGGDATPSILRTPTPHLIVHDSESGSTTDSSLQNSQPTTVNSTGLSIPTHLLHSDFQWLQPTTPINTSRHSGDISIPSASQVQTSLLQAVGATVDSATTGPLSLTSQEEQLTPLHALQHSISHSCSGKSASRLVYTPHPRTGQLLYVSQSDESPSFTQRIIWPGSEGNTRCQFTTPQQQVSKETNTPINLNSSGEENPSPEFLQPTPYNTPENGVFKCQHTLENLPFFNAGEDPGREQHNLKERRRRARVKDACNFMRKLVPGMSDKTDKATVFEFAARYIHFLKGYTGNEFDKNFLLKYSPY